MIDQINELPEDGLKSSLETSRFTENKWISRKNENKLYFVHLIDILNDLLLTLQIIVTLERCVKSRRKQVNYHVKSVSN